MALLITMPDAEEVTVWYCPECEETHTEEPELDKLYQCQGCGEFFLGSNATGKNGNACPTCGKFGTRQDEGGKLGALICPSCSEGVCVTDEQFECPECGELFPQSSEFPEEAVLVHMLEHAPDIVLSMSSE